MTPRTAGADDVETLLPMMAEFNASESIVLESDQLRKALLRLLDDASLGRVLLFENEGRTLGYAVVTWGYDLEHGGRDAFLTEIFLRNEARGRRLGYAALAACEAAAREEGASALHLMVRPENEPAVRLYRGAGYESPPRVLLSRRL